MGGPVFCFTETGVRYNVTPIQKKKRNNVTTIVRITFYKIKKKECSHKSLLELLEGQCGVRVKNSFVFLLEHILLSVSVRVCVVSVCLV